MKELGDSINSSLSESEQIAEVITRIKHEGYDVFLVLEATIGFNRNGESGAEVEQIVESDNRSAEFRVSPQDARFLKSLRIAVDDAPPDQKRAA
jgi:hypothetical protein